LISPFGEIAVWDQGDEVWDEEDEDSPLGVFPPDMPLDWPLDGVEDEDPSLAFWMPLKRIFIGK
jgi:hypothetical protein